MAEAIKQVFEWEKAFDEATKDLSPEHRLLKNIFEDNPAFDITDFSVANLEVLEEYPEFTVYKWDDTTSIMEIRHEDTLAYVVCKGEDFEGVGTLLEIPAKKRLSFLEVF